MIGGFQVGAFQPLPAYQQSAAVESRPTGGWERYKESFREESADERRKRTHAERIRRGILEPEKSETPEKPEKPVQRDDSLDLDFLDSGISLARLELKLIEAEMERAFPEPEPEMPDREVQARLIHALEYVQKKRMALLLLLL